MKRIYKLIQPLSIAMMVMGGLAIEGFFGGPPAGPVSQQIYDYRWAFAASGVAGVALIAASLLWRQTEMKFSTKQFLLLQVLAAIGLGMCLFFADTTSQRIGLYVPAFISLVVAVGSGFEFVGDFKKRLDRAG